MTSTPTPEQFLAQTDPDEDELEQRSYDALGSIAASLSALLGIVERHDAAETADAVEMGLEQPAADAPVEAWREYARQVAPGATDVDQMNRSQIRTLLGRPHFEA